VPVPRRSAPAVMPEAEVEHEVLSPIPEVAHQLEVAPLVAVDSGDCTLSLDPGPCGTKAGWARSVRMMTTQEKATTGRPVFAYACAYASVLGTTRLPLARHNPARFASHRGCFVPCIDA
jgi:hypothetical protein